MHFQTDKASYTPLEVIGKGSFGTVYKVRDQKGNIFAIKHAQLISVSKRKAFMGEHGILSSFDHEHIVPIIDFAEAKDDAFIVMPYIPGTLKDIITSEFPEPRGFDRLWEWFGFDNSTLGLSMKEKLRICQDIAEGLAYVHGHTIDFTLKDGSTETRPVIHRDLKPENILIKDGRAIIADFGLAYDSSKLAREKEFGACTIAYMSPEQVNGGMGLHPGSDVFSLALITYELFTGKRPFYGNAKTIPQLKVNYQLRIPELMHELNPEVPKELSMLVKCNISTFIPEQRDSAQEYASQLEEIANLPAVREQASGREMLRRSIART